jgi:cyclic pyranopterin phosphate synthase
MDPFGRKIDYLRISVTDRCNERCLYCMPEGYKGWESKPDHLTAQEIVRIVRVAAGLGFRKFRLTGGEPLVRGDVPEIVRAMTAIHGVECVALSTNGMKLAALAQPLARRRLAHGEREPRRAGPGDLPPHHRRRRGARAGRHPRGGGGGI